MHCTVLIKSCVVGDGLFWFRATAKLREIDIILLEVAIIPIVNLVILANRTFHWSVSFLKRTVELISYAVTDQLALSVARLIADPGFVSWFQA